MAAELVPRWRGRYIAAVVASGLGTRWSPPTILERRAGDCRIVSEIEVSSAAFVVAMSHLLADGRDRFYDLAILEETAALIPGCRLSLHPRHGHITVTAARSPSPKPSGP